MGFFDFLRSRMDPPGIKRTPARNWTTPGGKFWTVYRDLLDGGHLVIGGATGSGKSELIRELIHVAISREPCQESLVLIDPKLVDLSQYKKLPHVQEYGREPDEIADILARVCATMRAQYRDMERDGITQNTGQRFNIVVDEVADLVTGNPYARQIMGSLIELARLGRAARFRLILATQAPSRKTLPAELVQNCDRIALRCFDRIESRQIIGREGAETLPEHGSGIWRHGSELVLIQLPLTDEAERARVIAHWIAQV